MDVRTIDKIIFIFKVIPTRHTHIHRDAHTNIPIAALINVYESDMTRTTLWDYQTGKIWDCKKDMSMTLQKIKMILQIWPKCLSCVQHMSFRMGTKFLSEMTIINDILAAYPIWLLKCLCLWVCVFVWVFVSECVCRCMSDI